MQHIKYDHTYNSVLNVHDLETALIYDKILDALSLKRDFKLILGPYNIKIL